VIDSDVPDVVFDQDGVCNYCHQFDLLCRDYPMGEEGERRLAEINRAAQLAGRGKKYDVLIGVSGGTDSCYLLHQAVSFGLRPLCVHLDNGWDSSISSGNMSKMLKQLNADLITVKADVDEMRDLFLAFMKAGLPWIDGPSDIALIATLYNSAVKYDVKYIWFGHNFRTEGKQPDAWTHLDSRLIHHVHKRFGHLPLKHFADITPWSLFYWGAVRRIKLVRPINFMAYNKTRTKQFLADTYGWEDYGGHHYENEFTKFALVNWLYPKFGIDKRKITLSACVRSGEISRDDALGQLSHPPVSEEEGRENRRRVEERLGISTEEMDALLNGENHSFLDYPSYYFLYKKLGTIAKFVLPKILGLSPMMSYDLKKSGDN